MKTHISKKQLRIFTIILLTSLSIKSFAQEAQNEINLSIQGGLTFSDLRGFDNQESFSSRTAFLGGISLEVGLGENTAFVGDISYERKAVKNTFLIIPDPSTGIVEEIQNEINLDYVTIPLMFRYKIGSGTTRFFINAGPFVGFLLNATNNDEDYDNFKGTDFGLTGGVGLIVPVTDNNNLTIQVRNNFGLTNISDVPVINDGKIKTNSINAIVGFSFGL